MTDRQLPSGAPCHWETVTVASLTEVQTNLEVSMIHMTDPSAVKVVAKKDWYAAPASLSGDREQKTVAMAPQPVTGE